MTCFGNPMPRKRLIRNDWNPYHVTARVNNREDFYLPLAEQWEIFNHECFILRNTYDVEFHGFVMMPNHIHLILTVPDPDHDLGKIMSVFLSQVTLSSNRKSGRNGHLFGGPYHWTLIDSARYFYHAIKYIYRNPVRAGICEKVEDYPFSTFAGLFGRTSLPFPIHFTRAGMEYLLPSPDPVEWVDWLNRPFESELEKRIQGSLRKRIFGPKMNRKTRSLDSWLALDS